MAPYSPIKISPIGFENVIKTGNDYEMEYIIIIKNTGTYTGNIKITQDSKAVPNGVGRWVPNEGDPRLTKLPAVHRNKSTNLSDC